MDAREGMLWSSRRGETSEGASFDWVKQVDPDTALKQQERLTELVDAQNLVVRTAALDEAIE